MTAGGRYSGTYTPNVGGAWNSPNSETNANVPYDEIMEIRTTDNWATQGGIVIRYVARSLTRDGSPYDFWDEPLVAVSQDGRRIFFDSIDSGVLTGYVAYTTDTVDAVPPAAPTGLVVF